MSVITTQTTNVTVKPRPDFAEANVTLPRPNLFSITTPKGDAIVDVVQGDGQILFPDKQKIHLTGFVGPQTPKDTFSKALGEVARQKGTTGIDVKDVRNIHIDNATRQVMVNMGEGGKPAINLGTLGAKVPQATASHRGEGSPIAQDPVRELSAGAVHKRTIQGAEATIRLWQGDGVVELPGQQVLLTGWVGPVTNPELIVNALNSSAQAKKDGVVPADFTITHLNLDKKGDSIRVNPTSGTEQAYITDRSGKVNPTKVLSATAPSTKPTESSPDYADPLELTLGREVKGTFQGKGVTAHLWQGEGRMTLPNGEFVRLLGWVNENTSPATLQRALTAIESSNDVPRIIVFDVKGNHRMVK